MRKLHLLPLLFLFILFSCKPSHQESSDPRIRKIDSLIQAGYEIMDLHAHLKGGLTMEELLQHSDSTGIKYGVAVNCGLNFPVHNDSALSAYYQSVKHYPVYHALQAEGREWRTLVSADSIKLFDYVFTDAMTWTDSKGRRMRLWIKEEVWVDDAQDFMEQLVSQIETILNTEPINIYVNPSYLPDTLKDRYNELWTPERMQRVVAALVKNKIALEINSGTHLPSPAFIKLAKEAGVKFTLGTNNRDKNLGYLEYGMQMIEECGLKPDDFWKPAR